MFRVEERVAEGKERFSGRLVSRRLCDATVM